MEDKKQRVYKQILYKFKQSKKIAIISHKNPDLDSIGSATGLYQAINDNFKYKKIDLFCIDDIPLKYQFLPNSNIYQKDLNPFLYDLIIFVDSGSKTQTGYDEIYPKLYNKKTFNTLSIDHHITNELYAKQNILNTTYSSTTMIIFEILEILKLKISKNTSTSLLAGVYTDTGGFKHSNTNIKTFEISAKLFKLGGDYKLIIDRFFKNNKLSTLKLWGKIITDSFITENQVLNAYVSQTLLDSYNCDLEDITGVIDYLNQVQDIKYTTLLTQKGDYIKGSLRTLREDIDLTKIAKKYLGGGHKKASGFTTKGKINLNTTLKIGTK